MRAKGQKVKTKDCFNTSFCCDVWVSKKVKQEFFFTCKIVEIKIRNNNCTDFVGTLVKFNEKLDRKNTSKN